MKDVDIQAIKTLDPAAVFSISEAAKLLGLTHNGVLYRIGKGKMKAGKSGSRYFILGSELQKQVMLPDETEKVSAQDM